ncbi:HemX protein [Haemophilus paraphrohaemolyticus]|uniref:HemX protein n=1 Tax=Haemophilus paraphrohaemolyticus TaxID=736 RepID=A0A369ZR23_9PAST|nr:uroporphyrinogen-III C-methyltransferase [Haemophilus paraphrohaemolyticus]RDF12029.1 HemX protein [Haemophilus paraphrohaemolyticus]
MSEKNTPNAEETLEQAVESSEKFAENLASAGVTSEKIIVKKGGTVIGLLALLVSLAVGGAGYYFGSEKLSEVNTQLQALTKVASAENTSQAVDFSKEKAELAELSSSYAKAQDRIAQLEKEQVAYTNQISALQLQIEKVNLPQADSSAWLLSDANFLLNSALRKLKIDTDVDTAQSLLEEADTVLSKVTNPQLTAQVSLVRSAIQADLTNLKNLNQVDQNDLMQRLTSLANSLDDLPMLDNGMVEVAQPSGEVSDSIDDWQQNLEKTANSFLDHFIRVSDKNKNEDKGFIAPNQEVYLRENIRLRLQLAILAIPRQQNALYDKSLEAVGTWIRSYFDTQNENVKNFLKTLDELSEQSIYIDVPEKLQSSSMLNDILRKEPVKLDKIEIKEEKELVEPSAKEETKAEDPKETSEKSDAEPVKQDTQAQ